MEKPSIPKLVYRDFREKLTYPVLFAQVLTYLVLTLARILICSLNLTAKQCHTEKNCAAVKQSDSHEKKMIPILIQLEPILLVHLSSSLLKGTTEEAYFFPHMTYF